MLKVDMLLVFVCPNPSPNQPHPQPLMGAGLTVGVFQAEARVEMSKADMLLVPTALHHYTVQEIAEEERHADKVHCSRRRITNLMLLILIIVNCS